MVFTAEVLRFPTSRHFVARGVSRKGAVSDVGAGASKDVGDAELSRSRVLPPVGRCCASNHSACCHIFEKGLNVRDCRKLTDAAFSSLQAARVLEDVDVGEIST